MQLYTASLTEYKRLITKEVKIGDLSLGNLHPIRVQTMTTTDTMDTLATVEQSIRCIEAGAEMVRITAPSKKEAENLLLIKNELRKRGYTTPLVADIHFTPNAAEIAARIVEKVRVNPGNYVDKKKFELIEYTDADYAEEIDRIRERFTPLVKICREYGTAMRIGTNHGSLSDRIMSRYGDTPMGMVESAMEFLRIARNETYHNIVLSMKASNPQVMVQAYRLLVKTMFDEFGECYPLHLGVTEAGDGEDGRIKSAIGIGSLMEDGLGDTIRVSLTEDPELEIPVCKDLVKRYTAATVTPSADSKPIKLSYDPFNYQRRETFVVGNIGGKQVPVVIADLSKIDGIQPQHLQSAGYTYDEATDKWHISDAAADYVFTGNQLLNFELPGTLKVIVFPEAWKDSADPVKYYPIFQDSGYAEASDKSTALNFVMID
ncbi:MAG: 4-hydroxy-3-methylbut-2-en-1-yl diphosphate synthase, partial [Sphingobacteriales bacterium]